MKEQKTPQERFDEKWYEDENGCHIWTAAKNPKGYGNFGAKGKVHKSHRWAFERVYGYLPEVVMHICDVPSCVNPKHLRPGTHGDNVKDKMDKGRHNCARGEAHGGAKLTLEQVEEIREKYGKGGRQYNELGREYGVSGKAVSKIIKGLSWAGQGRGSI